MPVLATVLGHPRIGIARELKKALEAYWSGATPAESLLATAQEIRTRHWSIMKEAGLDQVPCNDFSLYDHMLDMAVTVGAIPDRFQKIADPLNRYFALARGVQDRGADIDLSPLEMTKWFDTNYHYIVPELDADQSFVLNPTKISAELAEAQALGITPRPVLPGPVTFLKLSKYADDVAAGLDTLELLPRLLPAYEELLALLAGHGVTWVQLDEPCLCFDLDPASQQAYRTALTRLAGGAKRPGLLVATYFGSIGENLGLVTDSGCEALHLDLVRAPEELDGVLAALPAGMKLSLGVVDGRNVWRADLEQAHRTVRRAVDALGSERVMVASSCSLLHVPVDLDAETRLDAELKSWMAFAAQKVAEVRLLADAAEQEEPQDAAFVQAGAALARRRAAAAADNPAVRHRAEQVTEAMTRRGTPFAERSARQKRRFDLPLLPTTTIGSFPQSREVREARSKWRSGALDSEGYQDFLRAEIRRCIEKQEKLGLDVLVHGEFERTDMVEYFGEQLDGFAFTQNGWVQSYGSRCVKPPVLYGNVARPRPMTVEWSSFAQSLSKRPVKGMLTGPVTILQWSFVRNDQPRSETCREIALALRDEVADLEQAGISMIQMDEPAIREGLPLRRRDWPEYLEWAVAAFSLSTAGVSDETQIHTHMCYSEFGDILPSIVAMDADVLSIESSRSRMELLSHFRQYGYPNDVGPGIYDIHSPRVPTVEEMTTLLGLAAEVLPAERLWVNPDCGLKTRGWPEIEASLANMVQAARQIRLRLTPG
ncbi:5-methyltetrahydropteroyltriglutamate--homocysteine S-methyltransferase [Geomonas nitrogeniifigens]|uniref:5-methyltetrahydropteroyltriglutamate--homocysteine methyltransferase n=1 Tax=Geomonas diazotrophica TaxID=2843197 RepID=A0ABX8JK84_9BACT|nr:5-methyltetrahydropteroyltriglutamate--homocysteine S-methyltransferase [Geomonas nitrogeniifigens]QWV98795.1 5-methyltetrahydropteroyltriglutamate--homocysteine S-methyltransferase [Geomonas nitrogeniifigens]QXE87952.1 5-methyltetrahydropteroyltriglutamate--homocysteine S-methyltransferase [Geomonas nitrogeniifigens]